MDRRLNWQPDALEWAAQRTRSGPRTLMVRPEADVGFTAKHFSRLLAFHDVCQEPHSGKRRAEGAGRRPAAAATASHPVCSYFRVEGVAGSAAMREEWQRGRAPSDDERTVPGDIRLHVGPVPGQLIPKASGSSAGALSPRFSRWIPTVTQLRRSTSEIRSIRQCPSRKTSPRVCARRAGPISGMRATRARFRSRFRSEDLASAKYLLDRRIIEISEAGQPTPGGPHSARLPSYLDSTTRCRATIDSRARRLQTIALTSRRTLT